MIDSASLLAIAVTAIGGFLRGFAGFGTALVIMPGFSLIYGPVEALAVFTLLELVASVQLLPTALRQAQWRRIFPLAAGALLTLPLGFQVLVSVDAELMRRVIAGVVLCFVLILATGWRYHGEPRPGLVLGVGAGAGLLGGATGIGGPPVVLFLLSGHQGAATVRGGIMAYFTFTGLVYLFVLGWHGAITPATWRHAGLLVLFYIASIWLGSRFFGRASEAFYRYFVLILLAVIALFTLVY